MPAIDLREGACVQLVGGSYDFERIRLSNPPAVALQWREAGFQQLHLVDLDAATGRGNNDEVVATILSGRSIPIQVGGGIRDAERVSTLIQMGAARIVLGTRAVEDVAWLGDVAVRYPQRLVVAADVRGRQVLTRGWSKGLGRDLSSVLSELNALPLAAVLITAVHKEGRMKGPDLDLMRCAVAESAAPIQASGGIGSMADLSALQSIGVSATVIGMALYSGALDARQVAKEFQT